MKKFVISGVFFFLAMVAGTAAYLWIDFASQPASMSKQESIYEVLRAKHFRQCLVTWNQRE
jgi:hypothetical protein